MTTSRNCTTDLLTPPCVAESRGHYITLGHVDTLKAVYEDRASILFMRSFRKAT